MNHSHGGSLLGMFKGACLVNPEQPAKIPGIDALKLKTKQQQAKRQLNRIRKRK